MKSVYEPNNSRMLAILFLLPLIIVCLLLKASRVNATWHKRIIILASMYSVTNINAIEGNSKRLAIYVNL